MAKIQVTECRYCDTGFPVTHEGEWICCGCGAEWAAAAITVERDESEFE